MTEYMQSKISQLNIEELRQAKANKLFIKTEEEKIKLQQEEESRKEEERQIDRRLNTEFDKCLIELYKGNSYIISLERVVGYISIIGIKNKNIPNPIEIISETKINKLKESLNSSNIKTTDITDDMGWGL